MFTSKCFPEHKWIFFFFIITNAFLYVTIFSDFRLYKKKHLAASVYMHKKE